MSTIRLVVSEELRKALDFLRFAEFPTLSDAELLKVTVSRAVTQARRAKKTLDYDDKEISDKDWIAMSMKSWALEDSDEEVFWDETNLKPFKFEDA